MLLAKSTPQLLRLFLPFALLASCLQFAHCQEPLVVFLVRHAEKIDNSEKSKLSKPGIERANVLATTLRDSKIKHIHSTDFPRTRLTAAPFANKHDLPVVPYDARKLKAFAEELKNTGGRHLVVGHSNTTPELVELLGGEPGPEIQEGEYDRLYIVSIGKDGVASSVLIRFGTAFVSPKKPHTSHGNDSPPNGISK